MGLLLLLVGVAVYFIFFASKKRATKGKTALDLLKEKFINGEIDEEAYKAKKDVITK